MQVSELGLECHNGMAIAGDVAGPAGASTHAPRGLDHGADDRGVAAHPEIIVRAPDDDLAGRPAAAPSGIGGTVSVPFEIGKNAVAVFPTDALEIGMKMIT